MNYAIILSGGIGTRMRTDGFPKQYLQVEGKTILQYTLETLADSEFSIPGTEEKENRKKYSGKCGKKNTFCLTRFVKTRINFSWIASMRCK